MNSKTKRHAWALAALSIALVFSSAAHADSLGVAAASSTLTGAAGSTVTFDAVVSNAGPDPIYINGDGSTLDSFLTLDDSPLFNLVGIPISPGSNTGPDALALFNILIAPGTAPGIYTGEVFTIYGGADGGAGTAYDDLADIVFNVKVTSAATPPKNTPEPGTLLLVASGIVSLALWRRRTNTF
jgi:hypothetical protein